MTYSACSGLAHKYTLVIPTFNRPRLLGALIRFLQKGSSRFKVIIADSSTAANQAENKRIAESAQDFVQYLAFPLETQALTKLNTALSLVTTDYVSFCGDDDIVFVDAVEKCVAALDQDQDLVGCHGIYLNFFVDDIHREVDVSLEYLKASVVDPDICRRVYEALANYEAPFYAVYRTDPFRSVMKAAGAVRNPSQDWVNYYWELFTAVAILAHGNIRRIEEVYSGRRTFSKTPGRQWHPTTLISQDPLRFFSEFSAYRNHLETYFATHAAVDGDRFKSTLILSHLAYIYDATRAGADLKRAIDARYRNAPVEVPGKARSLVRRWPLVRAAGRAAFMGTSDAVRCCRALGRGRTWRRLGRKVAGGPGPHFHLDRSVRSRLSGDALDYFRLYAEEILRAHSG